MARPRTHCAACRGPLGPSPREQEVLDHLADGKRTAEIAACLCLSPKTVETYIGSLLRKLRLPHVRKLIVYACHQACPYTQTPGCLCRGCAERAQDRNTQ